MDKKLLAATAVLLSLAWSACTSDQVKRAAYEAAYQKSCIDRTGLPACNPDHQDYDQYQSERGKLVKRDAP
jgi:hypothetical protein